MACDNLAIIVDQHRGVEPIALDRTGDLLQLLFGMYPCIGLGWAQGVNRGVHHIVYVHRHMLLGGGSIPARVCI